MPSNQVAGTGFLTVYVDNDQPSGYTDDECNSTPLRWFWRRHRLRSPMHRRSFRTHQHYIATPGGRHP